MAEQTMSLERAMENAIVSTEMEGFVVTREQRELMVRVLKRKSPLKKPSPCSARSTSELVSGVSC